MTMATSRRVSGAGCGGLSAMRVLAFVVVGFLLGAVNGAIRDAAPA
jgi:hypothetical protein